MPSGKLSSVLAAFETTIQKNNELNGSSHSRRRRKPGEHIFPEARKTPSDGMSPKRAQHGNSLLSVKQHEKSRKERSPRRPRPDHDASGSGNTDDRAPLTPLRSARASKLDEAYCSPTEETTETSLAGILAEVSPQHRNFRKLPSSLKRDDSGEALIAVAQKAVSTFSPSKKGKKRLNASLPIMGNLNNCDFSFCSLPVILPKTSAPSRSKPESCLQTTSQNLSIASNEYFEKKSYPKSPVPKKGKLKSLKDFDDEPDTPCSSDEVSIRSIYSYDPSRNSVKPDSSPRATLFPIQVYHDDSRCTQCDYSDPVVLLTSKIRPKSILLRKHHSVNRIRRVKFLDLQPGGGRRMSLETQNSKDSQPLRPRRAPRTIQNEHGGDNSKLAATKIQASIRGYLQWRKTRIVLLERKLQRIERNHQKELQIITEKKWKQMDALRNEAVEEQKRLDSQVELGDKLIEHLKRDSAMVRDQTKKLREHCKALRQSNAHCEHMNKLQSDSIATVKESMENLRQQQQQLLDSEQKLMKETQKMARKLASLSHEVKYEFDCKKAVKKTTRRIVCALSQRCRDEALLSLTLTLSSDINPDEQSKATRDTFSFTSLNSSPSSFVLNVRPWHDTNSVVSELTELGTSSTEKRSINAGGGSFAEYDPTRVVAQSPSAMLSIAEE